MTIKECHGVNNDNLGYNFEFCVFSAGLQEMVFYERSLEKFSKIVRCFSFDNQLLHINKVHIYSFL